MPEEGITGSKIGLDLSDLYASIYSIYTTSLVVQIPFYRFFPSFETIVQKYVQLFDLIF